MLGQGPAAVIKCYGSGPDLLAALLIQNNAITVGLPLLAGSREGVDV